MCLGVPSRVVRVEGLEADVEIAGVWRKASIALTPEVKPGQYVLLHAGYAISVLDERDALETLEIIREIA